MVPNIPRFELLPTTKELLRVIHCSSQMAEDSVVVKIEMGEVLTVFN
jgi:hypothetical protein